MRDGVSRPDGLESAVFSFLEEGLGRLPIEASEGQISQLTALAELLSIWAARINLTGHRDPIGIAGHLILDAAALSSCLPELKQCGNLADLGTGAGFPGLPIAILNPHIQVQLIDARQKRNHFQREARRRLQLDHVEPRLGRVERLERRPADIVVAQAMTQPDQALTLMAPWASGGGMLVLPASEGATKPAPPPGWELPEARSYQVPQTGTVRRIWILHRRD